MAKLRISTLEGRALLDIASYGRHGPGRRERLSQDEVALIGRTARRIPEVMVKVLSKDGNSLRSVARHLNYIGRRGDLELETDDGERVQGRNAGQRLVEDWDLDLDQDRKDLRLAAITGRDPKLVHKMMLSMPPGTPAKSVLKAARNFARDEFALKHRYALVLHTDEPHPHVHMVVKAVSEQGVRLNIRKATLRGWRQKFAEELRREGIAANATERAVRGGNRTRKTDGIYRASLRGESTHIRDRVSAVASDLKKGTVHVEEGRSQLRATRNAVDRGWRAASAILAAEGHVELAADVRRFVRAMQPPRTEREEIAATLLERNRDPSDRGLPITR